MKTITLILAIFNLTFSLTLGRISYDGLVLTSIDVKHAVDKPGFVTFSGGKAGKADDDSATFLRNVKQINDRDEDGERIFEAEKLTVQQAKAILSGDGGKKPLFCVHGFNVSPGSHLKNLKNEAKKFNKGKFTLVPVIWPSAGSVIKYWTDRDQSASGAGKAFKNFKAGINAFPQKSLLCHSMGNWVLRNAADESFRFDNVFMAAADVRADLFSKEYIRGDKDIPDMRNDGLEICKMLTNKKKGKVHILFNRWDYALTGSQINPTTSWVNRIGRTGNDEAKTDDEIKGRIKNFNAGSKLSWSNLAAHSYHFKDFCVKYYQDNHF